MEFKFDDGIDENGVVEKKGLSEKTKLIIVIVCALVVGLSVFFITYKIFGTKKETKEPDPIKTTISLTDEDVVDNYNMLIYGVGGVRTTKYISGINITGTTSFSNSEKYYYALQFCVKADLTDSGKKDESGNEIYTLPKSSMDIYMERYFGPDVSYSTDSEISNTFKFDINGFDTGTLKYDTTSKKFNIVFTSKYSSTDSDKVVEDYYYALEDAYTYSDNRLILVERILYTSTDNSTGVNNVTLYGDVDKTNTIGTLNNVTKDSLISNPIDVLSYNKAGTITYTLKLGNYGYYIVNSEVK